MSVISLDVLPEIGNCSDGKLVLGYENPHSIAFKCDFIEEKGLLEAMYWNYACDNEADELRKAVAEGILP